MSDWVLLRGLTREARHWGAFDEALVAHGVVGAGERVVCVDLPGNGAEHAHTAPVSVVAMMDFVRERAVSLKLRFPCRVLAMSLGAMVAAAWAERHAGEIERLVLINTSMRPFARLPERLRPTAWPMLARIAYAWSLQILGLALTVLLLVWRRSPFYLPVRGPDVDQVSQARNEPLVSHGGSRTSVPTLGADARSLAS